MTPALQTALAELAAARAARQKAEAQVQSLPQVLEGASARVAWIKAADAQKIVSAVLQVHDRLVVAESAAEKRVRTAERLTRRAPDPASSPEF